VIREKAFDRFDAYAFDVLAAQQFARSIRTGEPGARRHLTVVVEGRLHAHARPEAEQHARDHDEQIERIEKHGFNLGRRGWKSRRDLALRAKHGRV
jgi:hypothetical protein